MQNELFTNQGKPFLRWELDEVNNWLYLNWMGYVSKENGFRGSEEFLEILKQHHFKFLLNDNRKLEGPWGGGEEGTKWLEEYLFPNAAKAGLRYFAHVLSPGMSSALMAQDLHHKINGTITMRLFGEMEKAQQWLKEMQQVTLS